jgi:PAS domain S-box-containing protein
LLLLLLIIFLPAAAIIITTGMHHRRDEIAKARDNALLLAQSLATQQEQIALGARTMLGTLAQLPVVRSLDAKACNKLFLELHHQYPFYSVIMATTPDGNVFAASVPFEPGSNVSDRKHIRDAIRTLDFSAGEYIKGRLSNIISLNFGYPVLDANKKVIAIVIAGFDLRQYARFVSKVNLSQGYAVTITDWKGVRLFRWPGDNASTSPGRAVGAASFAIMSGESEQGFFETAGQDGVERIYAFRQLRLRPDLLPYLYMIVGAPREKILHQANLQMALSLSMLGVTAVIGLFFARVFGNHVFIKPINRLVAAAQRFGKGEMHARTGLPHTPDEFGRLARSFDAMASLVEMRSVERRDAQKALGEAYAELEARVEELTAELSASNAALSKEIAGRERMEKALRVSEATYRRIFESLQDLYYQIDNEGIIRVLSPSLTRLAGWEVEELTGRPVTDVYADPSDRQGLMDALSRNGFVRDYEVLLKKKDGTTINGSLSAQLILDEQGHPTGLGGILRDITERKQVEEEIRRTNRRLEEATARASEMAVRAEAANHAKSEFLANMSHELRTPLNSIIGFTEVVLDKHFGDLNESQEEYLGYVLQSSRHLLSLINDILDLSKVEAGKMELSPSPFNPSDLLKGSLGVIKEKALKHRIALSADFDELPELIEADERKLKQIIYNLLSNAVKFTPDGGTVVLAAASGKKGDLLTGATPAGAMDNGCAGDGPCLMISVSDMGIGIREQDFVRIFNPFEQVDSSAGRRFQGTGLGLSLTKRLVELHRGAIWVESAGEHKGSTFRVLLPLSPG